MRVAPGSIVPPGLAFTPTSTPSDKSLGYSGSPLWGYTYTAIVQQEHPPYLSRTHSVADPAESFHLRALICYYGGDEVAPERDT